MPERTPRNVAERIARECYARRARVLGRSVTRLFDEALRPLGMTAAQLNLLVAVSLHPGVRAADLAESLNLEKSTLSRNLARMIEHGWLRAEHHGREQRLSVLAAGTTLLQRAYPAWREAQREVRATFDAPVLEGLDAL